VTATIHRIITVAKPRMGMLALSTPIGAEEDK
jgi:hypothetical protein